MRELSQKNPYWIPQYRYLELKNFVLQYDDWKREIDSIDILGTAKLDRISSGTSDPVWTAYRKRELYLRYISIVERAADETDDTLGKYVLIAVTGNHAYHNMRLKYNIPCCEKVYYKMLRRFFYILDTLRDS